VSNVENYEEYKRKFPSSNQKGKSNRSNFRKGRNYKKNMYRITEHNHEWKDCPRNPYNKVKKEENNNISDESSVSSSDESMRMMEYDSSDDETTYSNLLGLREKDRNCNSSSDSSKDSSITLTTLLGLLDRS